MPSNAGSMEAAFAYFARFSREKAIGGTYDALARGQLNHSCERKCTADVQITAQKRTLIRSATRLDSGVCFSSARRAILTRTTWRVAERSKSSVAPSSDTVGHMGDKRKSWTEPQSICSVTHMSGWRGGCKTSAGPRQVCSLFTDT